MNFEQQLKQGCIEDIEKLMVCFDEEQDKFKNYISNFEEIE